MKLQKLGGYFCIAYILVVVFVYMIAPTLGYKPINEITDPAEAMNIFKNDPLFLRILLQIAAIFAAISYVVIAMALRERMHSKAPNLMNFAVIAALIAVVAPFHGYMINDSLKETMVKFQDPSPFIVARGIQTGLTSAATQAWGWVFILTGIVAIRTQMLPKILGYLILVLGFGCVFVFAIKQVEIILHLLMPIAFIWLGIHLIRNPEPNLE